MTRPLNVNKLLSNRVLAQLDKATDTHDNPKQGEGSALKVEKLLA